MISYYVLVSFFVFDFHIELLQQQNPANKPQLCILLRKQVGNYHMVSVHNCLGPHQVRLELIKSVHHG